MSLISVIIPVYNMEEYLERCVQSVLEQKEKDLEIILVDDGSTDQSGKLCDFYQNVDSRIRVIHKTNGGLSSARNAGLKIATGRYIGFVDSDDWITSDMYSYLYSLIQQTGAEIASVSYKLCKDYPENSLIKKRLIVKSYSSDEALEYYLKVGNRKRINDYSVWTKLYRRDLFENTTFPEGHIYEDITTNFELISKCNKYVKSNKICYFYFQGGSSILRSGFKNSKLDLLTESYKLFELAVKTNNITNIKEASIKVKRSYLSLLLMIITSSNREEYKKQEDYLRNKLLKYYKDLLYSSIPISRKLIMTGIYLNTKLKNEK